VVTESRPNPYTAYVHYTFEEDVPGSGCIGRAYYWFDPKGEFEAVGDYEFRQLHPEISDRDWQQLFYEAFERGETAFLSALVEDNPDFYKSETGRLALAVGRLFGPRPPRDQDG
jgi:hypothetical protein